MRWTGCIWLTGLPCSGKTTLADALIPKLEAAGYAPYRLDGDVIRRGLSCDLGFSAGDRRENLRRVAYVCSMLCDNGILPVASFVSPSESVRGMVKEIVGADRFFLIHVDCPAETCELRDVKGMWAKARQGEIKAFTGIDDPYESPVDPDVTVETDGPDVEYCVASIMDAFEGRIQ
jgi:adenylylsulfate kinase